MLKILEYIIIIIFSLIFLVGIVAMGIQIIGNDSVNKATIISGMLSFLGGSLGALGAYYAANIQIKHERETVKVNEFKMELPVYIAVEIELDKIIFYLKLLNESTEINEKFSKKSANEFFNENTIKFDEINWHRWNEINKISDTELLKDLYVFENVILGLITVLEYDMEKNQDKLISFYFDKGSISSIEFKRLKMEIERISAEREAYYDKLAEILSEAKSIKNSIKFRKNYINNTIGDNNVK